MSFIAGARGFDFHCHVDLDRNPAELVRRCDEEKIFTLAVTTTPKAWPQNRRWASQSRFVAPALGLHPELIGDRYEEVALLEKQMPEARFVGEVGLDGSPRYCNAFSRQQDVFGRILRLAQCLEGRVLTIHSRGASKEVVDMIGRYTSADRVLCILHWFSGSAAIARKAADLGCWFSINGQMLSSKRGEALVRSLPRDRLLTETDSPFAKQGSRPSLPWDVMATTHKLATLYGESPRETAMVLRTNAMSVLQFADIS